MNKKNINKTIIALNLITMTICFFLYQFLGSGLQIHGAKYHLGTRSYISIYSQATLMGLLIVFLCLFKKMHSFQSQRVLLLSLLGLLFAFLFFPTYLHSTTIVFLSNMVLDLLEPWRQAFVSPSYRAIIEVLQVSVEGVLHALIYYKMSVEFFNEYVRAFKYIGGGIFILLLSFVMVMRVLKNFPTRSESEKKDHHQTLHTLIRANLDVFLLAVMAGFAVSAQQFAITYVNNIPKYNGSQYVELFFVSGGVMLPLFIGYFADKKGIAKVAFRASLLLVILKFVSVLATSVVEPPVFFALFGIFVAGGISQVLPALTIALVGHRFSALRLFAAWALSSLFIRLGQEMAAQVYAISFGIYHSFALTQFITGLCMLILLLGAWQFKQDNLKTNK